MLEALLDVGYGSSPLYSQAMIAWRARAPVPGSEPPASTGLRVMNRVSCASCSPIRDPATKASLRPSRLGPAAAQPPAACSRAVASLALVIRGTAKLRGAGGAGAWFLAGLLDGFLPCGPVYAVATGTVVSSPLAGAAGMALFGLGTMPALLLLAIGTERLSPRPQRRFTGWRRSQCY